MNQQQFQSTLSIYNNNQDMPFLQEDNVFYQEQATTDDHHQQPKMQQGDDFRPTFYNPFEIKHRRRTSRAQFKVLEKTFLENQKPNAAVRRWLAQKLAMTPRGVQVWFQNRRAKEKSANAKSTVTSIVTCSSPSPSSSVSSSPTSHIMPFSSSFNMYTSEPLISDNSQYSMMTPSPTHSACACADCSTNAFTTPMSRTLSYPPFYSDASCSAADEEELLMTPVTPSVDQQQQHYMFDPVFFNSRKFGLQQQDWLTLPNFLTQDINYALEPSNDIRLYDDTNSLMFDNRRYSLPVNAPSPHVQSAESFRRLSEPIFDHLNNPFDLLPRTAL